MGRGIPKTLRFVAAFHLPRLHRLLGARRYYGLRLWRASARITLRDWWAR